MSTQKKQEFCFSAAIGAAIGVSQAIYDQVAPSQGWFTAIALSVLLCPLAAMAALAVAGRLLPQHSSENSTA